MLSLTDGPRAVLRSRLLAVGLAVAASLAACSSDDENPARAPSGDDRTVAGLPMGSRRISIHEYNQILRDVLKDDVGAAATRIEDTQTGFDDDIGAQPLASAAYIDDTEATATDAASRFVTNPAAWTELVPCAPAGPGDDACLRQFVARVGRRLLRRTLAADEVDRYVTAVKPFAVEKNDFKVGAQLVVQALLQDPEFLYVIRATEPLAGHPGTVALTGPSRASALSFFLWGTTPDDALLDKAERGDLGSASNVAEVAKAMLDDPRAKAQVDRFVAMWLGYERNPVLTPEMRREIEATLERAVFEKDTNVMSIFTQTDTFLPTDALADAYGLPHPPPGGGWVPYGEGRAGILSTGAALTMGAKGGDTSPTQRGKAILAKLMCTPMQRPANVNVDEPPATPDNSPCKVPRYKAISASAACAGCHATLDGLGFGLESYDLHGRYRTHDDNHPECAIPGDGELPGVGTFKGPGELGALLMKTGKLEGCFVRQLYRYALGRQELPDDDASIGALTSRFQANERSMKKLLLTLVSSNAFLTAKEAP